jgi:tRNA (cytidine32/uridine32-2'-O)-methyltransferase
MSNNNISIVLVGTSHPGNIGGVARAMKNMCLSNLVLVEPRVFPSAEATSRAAGADDILQRARVCANLKEAVQDCHWVVGSSARLRKVAWPMLSPRQCAEQTRLESANGPVAIVFGREHSGLTNEEMDLCHALVTIPSNPDFSSLNIAAATQVIAYELYLTGLATDTLAITRDDDAPLATTEQLEEYFKRMEDVLTEVGFLQPPKCEQLVRRLRRIYSRARLDQRELNILHGILSATLGNKYRWQEKVGLVDSAHGQKEKF